MRASQLVVGLIGIATLILIAVAASLDKMPKTSSDVTSLFPKNSASLSAYERTNALYGNYVHDVIAVQTDRHLTSQTRDALYELEEELAQLEGLEEVISPAVAFSKSVQSPFPLRSASGTAARFLLKLDGSLSDQQRATLNSSINTILQHYDVLQPARAGAFFISESVTRVIDRETKERIPTTIAVLLIIASLLLRSVRLAIVMLIAPMLSVLWTVVSASLFGLDLGPISQLAPPFLLAVGSSYSIHVATRLLQCSEFETARTFAEVRFAVCIAAATTVVGIGSLAFLQIRAIFEFSLLASIGIILSACFSLALTPLLIGKRSRGQVGAGYELGSPEKKHKTVALIIAATVLAGFGVPQIVVHTNPMMFLPDHSWERAQIDAVQKSFPGNRMLSIVFEKKRGELTTEDLAFVDSVASQLATNRQIFSIVSDGSFKSLAGLKKEFAVDAIHYAPTSITTANRNASRIIVETGLEGAPLLELAQELNELVQARLNASANKGDVRVHLSGLEILIADQVSTIVWGIIESLLFTLAVIAVILFALFRDIRVVLIGLVPNVIPVAVVLGAIGWLYRDINLGASLVGAAALSIAVDNTFHFLISWTREKESAPHTASATLSTLNRCFPAFLTSSAVLTAGFMTMALSQVLPVQQFGLLLSITLVVGLLADTCVLPYLTAAFERSA